MYLQKTFLYLTTVLALGTTALLTSACQEGMDPQGSTVQSILAEPVEADGGSPVTDSGVPRNDGGSPVTDGGTGTGDGGTPPFTIDEIIKRCNVGSVGYCTPKTNDAGIEFDCDNFSEVLCLCLEHYWPGSVGDRVWQITTCCSWHYECAVKSCHAYNVLQLDSTTQGKDKYCVVEPQVVEPGGTPVRCCWEQNAGTPMDINASSCKEAHCHDSMFGYNQYTRQCGDNTTYNTCQGVDTGEKPTVECPATCQYVCNNSNIPPECFPCLANCPPPDAGTPDSGTPDAGTPVPDASTPVLDSGAPVLDSGTPDAGTPVRDAATRDAFIMMP